MFHDYPYTDFHEMNLDYILKLCRESLGIHLVVSGNNLQLVNDLNQVLSQVTISFAETAAKDTEGNNITAYLIDAARSGRAIVFTSGDGNENTVQLPTDALTDINGKDITSYIARVDVSGQKLRITDGAGNAYTFTVPFANAAGKAETDINDKAITSYVADLVVSGNNLIVKDGNGNTLRTLTVSYADESGTANKARKDLNNNEFLSDYAELIVVDSDGKRIGLEAHDGTRLSTITVPFATLATDATNAIESVLVNGNQLQFRTYGGTVTNITVPYALKATSDGSNNEIVSNYVADVVNDAQTGKITFLAKDGSTIAELIPTVDSAVHDSYGNTIADFVKTIAVSAGSDYVTVTHGTGTTETLLIDFSNRSWKDTNGNIIKNVYLKSLECVPDADTGHYVLVGYNGENSEILRIEIYAYMAQRAIGDEDGNNIKNSYIATGLKVGNDLQLRNMNGNVVSTIPLEKTEFIKGNEMTQWGFPINDFYAYSSYTGVDPSINEVSEYSAPSASAAEPFPYLWYGSDLQVAPKKLLDGIIKVTNGNNNTMIPLYADAVGDYMTVFCKVQYSNTIAANSIGPVMLSFTDTRFNNIQFFPERIYYNGQGYPVMAFYNGGGDDPLAYVFNTNNTALTFTADDELYFDSAKPYTWSLNHDGMHSPVYGEVKSDNTGLAIVNVLWKYKCYEDANYMTHEYIADGLDVDATRISAEVSIIPAKDKSSSDYTVGIQWAKDYLDSFTDGAVPTGVSSGDKLYFRAYVYLTSEGDLGYNRLYSDQIALRLA